MFETGTVGAFHTINMVMVASSVQTGVAWEGRRGAHDVAGDGERAGPAALAAAAASSAARAIARSDRLDSVATTAATWPGAPGSVSWSWHAPACEEGVAPYRLCFPETKPDARFNKQPADSHC